MNRIYFILAALCLATSSAQAAGFMVIETPPDVVLQPLRGALWYPCDRPPSDLRVGPFTMAVAKDCPVAGNKLPLLVISHGQSGNFLGHRDTAEALADAGFVVVAINHPGDTATDSSRTNDVSVFVERPADIKRVIDFMLSQWSDASRIDPSRIGAFGFSRGGYTGLVVAGASPTFGKRLKMCDGADSPICEQIHQGALPELTHDPRIRAAVIADPLTIFFTENSFRNVSIPIQLWRSERGGSGVTPQSIDAVAGQLPAKPDFHVVPHSHHFAFIPPCPPELARSAPEICDDGPGFDRIAFHKAFNAEVLTFFQRNLAN